MTRRTGLILAGLALLFGLLAWGWQAQRAREAAELQLGLDSTRVLSQAFGATNQLKVAGISGELVARASDPGMLPILSSSQTMKAPYSVDYFIDLGQLQPSAFSWDAKGKRIVIELPDVTTAKPNIDTAAASVSQSGLYITRGAGLRMQRAAAQALALRAGEEAKKPENLAKARAAALAAVKANALGPLRAAGKDDVSVEVRFAFQRNNSDDVWDYTTPIDQVAEKLAQMKGGSAPQ